MIFSIRKATREDLQYVMDIDLKCYEYPWSSDFWHDAASYETVVGTFYGTPVGMAVFANGPVICPTFCHDVPEGVFTLLKLAVKERFRRRGLGRMLLNYIKGVAWTAKSETLISIVPESICLPGSKYDASVWLNRMDFEARNIIPACFTNCGEAEDGYLFEWVKRENKSTDAGTG